MPPSLPHVSGAEAIRALEKLGFAVVRQRGSHVVLRRGASGCVVPLHCEPPVPVWLELHTGHEPRMRVAASEARQFQ